MNFPKNNEEFVFFFRNLSVSSVYQLHPIPVLTGPRDLTSPSSMSQSNLEDEGYATPMTDVVNPSHIASEDDSMLCKFKKLIKITVLICSYVCVICSVKCI